MCGHRCSGFWTVIAWPLTLRTLHMTSFLYIAIFLLGNFFLWLAVVFVVGALPVSYTHLTLPTKA